MIIPVILFNIVTIMSSVFIRAIFSSFLGHTHGHTDTQKITYSVYLCRFVIVVPTYAKLVNFYNVIS